jgi:hypothetical protein
VSAGDLLLEGSGTNLVTYSEEFNESSWSKDDATVSENQTEAPDGTLTADKIQIANTTSSKIYYSNSFAAGTHTFSFWIKAVGSNTGTWSINWWNTSEGNHRQTVPVTTEWVRQSITFTNNSGTFVYIADNRSSLGSLAEVYIWGAQLEANSYATSYIPTTGSTATRAADVSTSAATFGNSWYEPDEGTVFAEGARNFTISSQFPRILSFGTAGSNAELIDILGASGDDRLDVVESNISQAQLRIVPDTAAFTRSSYAAAFKNNNFAFTRNGDAVLIDTSGTVPAVSQLRIGDRQDGVRTHNGTIRRLTYWPTRLSNDTLQTITV